MKTIILTHDNVGTFYERNRHSQEDANEEMLRGCELRPQRPMTKEELEEAKNIKGPF